MAARQPTHPTSRITLSYLQCLRLYCFHPLAAAPPSRSPCALTHVLDPCAPSHTLHAARLRVRSSMSRSSSERLANHTSGGRSSDCGSFGQRVLHANCSACPPTDRFPDGVPGAGREHSASHNHDIRAREQRGSVSHATCQARALQALASDEEESPETRQRGYRHILYARLSVACRRNGCEAAF